MTWSTVNTSVYGDWLTAASSGHQRNCEFLTLKYSLGFRGCRACCSLRIGFQSVPERDRQSFTVILTPSESQVNENAFGLWKWAGGHRENMWHPVTSFSEERSPLDQTVSEVRVLSWQECVVWSSAAVPICFKFNVLWIQRYSKQSGRSPLTSDINKAFSLRDLLLTLHVVFSELPL